MFFLTNQPQASRICHANSESKGIKMIVKMLFGSHLYGTNTENSDRDYKGIYLPTREDCYLGKISKSIYHTTGSDFSKNTSSDTDEEIFSLQYFMKLAINGEMIVIDMLHAPSTKLLESSVIWESLVENRRRFYSKNLSGYLGYIRKQTAKYGVKGSRLSALENVIKLLSGSGKLKDVWDELPVNEYCKFVENPKEKRWKHYEVCGKQLQESISIEYARDILQKTYDRYGDRAKQAQANEGIDWKAVSHAFRAGFQLKEIYKTGDLRYPLKEANFLKDIKLGNMHYINDGIAESLESLLRSVELSSLESVYPEKIDIKWVEDFILNCYR